MHAYANPTRFLAIAKPLTPWLLGVGLLLVLGGAFAGLTMVPGEAKQGETARARDAQQRLLRPDEMLVVMAEQPSGGFETRPYPGRL